MSEKNSLIVSGGLVGAAALAATSGAYAVVVPAASLPAVTPTTATLLNQTPWDIDGDGFTDLIVIAADNSGPFTGTTWSSQLAMVGNTAVGYTGAFGFEYVTNLAAGVDVGSQAFSAGYGAYGQMILGSIYGASPYGQFVGSPGVGYVGIQFSNVSGVHNAWALVSSTDFGDVAILGAFYNDEVGGAIATGQIPAPGTLGALAFGALAFSRRSRRHAA